MTKQPLVQLLSSATSAPGARCSCGQYGDEPGWLRFCKTLLAGFGPWAYRTVHAEREVLVRVGVSVKNQLKVSSCSRFRSWWQMRLTGAGGHEASVHAAAQGPPVVSSVRVSGAASGACAPEHLPDGEPKQGAVYEITLVMEFSLSMAFSRFYR